MNIEFKIPPEKLHSYKLEALKVNDCYHVEIWIVTENYHSFLPFEHEFKEAELNKDTKFLEFWGKYRKGQKRYKYTEEEFFNKFNIIK